MLLGFQHAEEALAINQQRGHSVADAFFGVRRKFAGDPHYPLQNSAVGLADAFKIFGDGSHRDMVHHAHPKRPEV
ncbi:hypothetical protein D3C73_1472310 [compost metagenome]